MSVADKLNIVCGHDLSDDFGIVLRRPAKCEPRAVEEALADAGYKASDYTDDDVLTICTIVDSAGVSCPDEEVSEKKFWFDDKSV